MNHNVDQATIYSAGLAVSTNTWVEQVTTDIPFLSLGITALAALTCLLLTQRLSFPASCILASAFLAFNGAIFDFVRLLQEAKSDTSNGTFAVLVLREVNFSLSIALNYLYFLTYLGRPPRGELRLCPLADEARARRESPSRWGHWGVSGYLIQAVLGASIVSVAVLEIIWRVSGNAGSTIYMANGIIQGVLSLAFLGKVFLNTYLSPLSPRWKTARDYLPVTFCIAARLGIILASEFTIGFTESSLGRLFQAIQLYILIVFSLVSPYYGERERAEAAEKPVAKRASSFRGLRFSNVPSWSALNSAPPDANGATTEKNIPTDVDIPRRPSPTQRLSSWLNNRLVPKRDPQEDRLWNKDQPDLEAPPTPGDRIPDDDPSPIQAKYSEKPLTATWQGPYINTQNTTEASTSDAMSPFTSTNGTNLTTPISAPPKAAAAAPSLPGISGTQPILPTGKFMGQFEVRQSFESGSDSPVYGINGIIQREDKRQNSQRSRRSTYIDNNDSSAIIRLQKEQAELERSMASMAAFSPSRDSFAVNKNPTSTTKDSGYGRARLGEPGGNQFTASFMSAGPSESFKSDFSLRDFPSPPGSVYTAGGARQEPTSPENVVSNKDSKPVEIDSGERLNATEIVEDVQFAMVPPRAAFQRRRASFPVIIRESATSSMDGMSRIISTYAESEDDIGGKRVRMSGVNNRLDVTSFIGELTTPEVSKGFTPKRSNLRNPNESMDSRLSPLQEDSSSPRPSVEIIDMRLKSTAFSPAIAITTGEKSPFSTEAPRKVSFAPVTYDASGRPRQQLPLLKTPSNTLPSSPRPSGTSPIASPNRSVSFKPVTSSPLASPGAGFSPTSRGAPASMARSKPTYPSYTKGGLKPIISGPFPLGSVKESDTKQTRRNPPPRF